MVTLTMTTDNAAFTGNPEGEVARIIHDLATDIERGLPYGRDIRYPLLDGNGNTVGRAVVYLSPPEED